MVCMGKGQGNGDIHGDGEEGTKAECDNLCVPLLRLCSQWHGVLEGWWCFNRMIRFYGIEPNSQTLWLWLDGSSGASRVGRRPGRDWHEKMTVEPAPALGALLSAARSQSDSKLGEIVSNKLIDLWSPETYLMCYCPIFMLAKGNGMMLRGCDRSAFGAAGFAPLSPPPVEVSRKKSTV
ncbi:hypothetical protein J5N97_025114 [Dioscorea zingiberensis]|uniref:Uncharacterized protein n=1 Tax=Dioscorea zingiberensis TaxID=325984 RepID=A0A9D5C7P5_9LILI|nr:hypothetical protein J5N97_025114 [Dioscorea zingiberensis]